MLEECLKYRIKCTSMLRFLQWRHKRNSAMGMVYGKGTFLRYKTYSKLGFVCLHFFYQEFHITAVDMERTWAEKKHKQTNKWLTEDLFLKSTDCFKDQTWLYMPKLGYFTTGWQPTLIYNSSTQIIWEPITVSHSEKRWRLNNIFPWAYKMYSRHFKYSVSYSRHFNYSVFFLHATSSILFLIIWMPSRYFRVVPIHCLRWTCKQKKYNQQNSTDSLNRASGSFFCLGLVPIAVLILKTRKSGLSGSGMFPKGGQSSITV